MSFLGLLTGVWGVLIPQGENKTTATIFEPNLKQFLLNAGQEDGHWPGPCPVFLENDTNHIRQELIKANPTRLCTSHFCLTGNKRTSDLLPVCVHPAYVWSSTSCAVGITTLFTRVKTCGFLSYRNSLQHFSKVSVLGQVVFTDWRQFLFSRSFKHSNLNFEHHCSSHSSMDDTQAAASSRKPTLTWTAALENGIPRALGMTSGSLVPQKVYCPQQLLLSPTSLKEEVFEIAAQQPSTASWLCCCCFYETGSS